MSKLVIEAIGPAVRYRTADRPGAQRYGLGRAARWIGWRWRPRTRWSAMSRSRRRSKSARSVQRFTARGGAVASHWPGPAQCRYPAERVPFNTSATLADGETGLTLGFARGGSFGYLAIEGGIAGEPMFGSLAVNARAGLGSPYPRPLRSGDELQTGGRQRRAGAADRAAGVTDAPIRVVWVRRMTSSPTRPKLFIDSEWKVSATSDRMGYRLEGPVLKHLHGHNIVSDGTVNGSIQVPGMASRSC